MTIEDLFYLWLITYHAVGVDVLVYAYAGRVLFSRATFLPSGVTRWVTLPTAPTTGASNGFRDVARRVVQPGVTGATVHELVESSLLDRRRYPMLAVLSIARIRIRVDGGRAELSAWLSVPWPITLVALTIFSAVLVAIRGTDASKVFLAACLGLALLLLALQRLVARSMVEPALEELAEEIAS